MVKLILKILFIVVAFALIMTWCAGMYGQSYYALPNVNSGCPSNCRQITWQAGSDIWNGGVLPTYTPSACSAPVSPTDATSAINACINAASSGTAVTLAAGTYQVNGAIQLKSNVVLRGAKAEGGPPFLPSVDSSATTLVLGSAGCIMTDGSTCGNSTHSMISPTLPAYNNNGVIQSTYTISGAPQKGDTTVTDTSGQMAAGKYIAIFGNDNPSLINPTGEDGLCAWCGTNTSSYVMQQIVGISSMAGSVATLAKQIYFTPYTTAVTRSIGTEPAGAKYQVFTFPVQKAGVENLRISGGSANIGGNPIIFLQGCLYCWVKAVETYDTGGSSGSVHVELDDSYGAEIRDSAFHDQRSGASGAGYGVHMMFANSDHKIENNIFFHNRHSIAFEGGGSGVAILYNYLDDMYTDDLTYLGSARTHGAHPFMDLFEGNIISHWASDDYWGSSSHIVFFRNWLWGGETNNTGSSIPSFPPNNGFDAIDLYNGQPYYAFVDNVLGTSASAKPNPSGGVWGTWSSATLSTVQNGGYDSPSTPGVYSYGGALGSTATSSGTIIRQGNYDFKTLGVAYNDGGSGFSYQPSYYYSSKPSFIGSCGYPAQGSDLTTKGSLSQPAYQRAIGGSCGLAPLPPTNVAVQLLLGGL